MSLACGDRSIFLNTGLESHHCRVPRISRHQFFNISHRHTHRTASGLGQPETQVRIHEPTFAAEISADGRWVDPNLVGWHIDAFGQLLTNLERHFAIHPSLHPTTVVQKHYRGMRFDVRLVLMVSLECMFEYQVSFGKTLLDITIQPLGVASCVRLRWEIIRQARIGREFRMKYRRSRFHSFGRIKYRI